MHHFNWLIDNAEHVYYTWQTPAKGGPQLKTLPTVGIHGQKKGAQGTRRPGRRTSSRSSVTRCPAKESGSRADRRSPEARPCW